MVTTFFNKKKQIVTFMVIIVKNIVISKTKKRRILRELRYYLSIIEKDLTNYPKYPQTITLLETINQNLKIQNQTMLKSNNKSKVGTKKI